MLTHTQLPRPDHSAGLACWLSYIEQLHDKVIDLGLERMAEMVRRLDIRLTCPVFTVAGTNGKGSTCAMLESILRAQGYRVGMHTSPHLIRFNERIVMDGKEVSDSRITEAFSAVEEARGDLPLSYFEFTGLAVLWLFAHSPLDAVILEIGLGGRLDAMNVIDTSCGIVCAIGIDHVAFLGDTREKIAYEKACIYRPGVPAVCTDRDPPSTLLAYAQKIQAPLSRYGVEFETTEHGSTFDYRLQLDSGEEVHFDGLCRPALQGANQIQNAAGVLTALLRLRDRLPVDRAAVQEGLRTVRVTGRFETVRQADASGPCIILDVGHNPQAAAVLAGNLAASCQPSTQTWAVFGMLADKDMASVARIVAPQIDRWFVASLSGARGASSGALVAAMANGGVDTHGVEQFESIALALHKALEQSRRNPCEPVRIIIFGSFVTVAAAIEAAAAGPAFVIYP